MKKLFLLLLICLVQAISATAVIEANLQAAMERTSEPLPVIVIMQQQTDTEVMLKAVRGMTPIERRAYAIRQMQAVASASQQPVLAAMNTLTVEGEVTDITSLWVVNVVTCYATTDAIRTISAIPGVDTIVYNAEQQLLDPQEWAEAYPVEGGSRTVAWNVSTVDADEVWDEGYTGAGVLVAVIDTGVNYNHVDLADHMWDGGEAYPYHGYDTYNNDNNPIDDNGHGTHCAGTVAGDGTGGTNTGVAPDATIMAIKVLSADGGGTESNVWNGFQFAVSHEARVISLSLGWSYNDNPSRAAWRQLMENVLAAGVVVSAAVGNFGDETAALPIPHNTGIPADCPPPWSHPDQSPAGGHSAVISVGATNFSDDIAYFSSRGPCEWGTITTYGDYPYAQGGLLKPDLCAPGVDITSLNYANNTGYVSGWNGTSMAAPCVAGTIALMLQHNPYMSPEVIDQIIEENVLELTEGKDNDYGSGLVNAYDAWDNTPSTEAPPAQAINPSPFDDAHFAYIHPILVWDDGLGTPSDGYNVYLGTDNPPTNIVNNETVDETSYQAPQLQPQTRYWWRIDSWNQWGLTTGTVWTFVTGDEADETFASGDFSAMEWENASNVPWTIVNTQSLDGDYCAQAGLIGNNATSVLNLTVWVTEPDTLAFYVKTSCEEGEGTDILQLYVNYVEIERWWGETEWTLCTVPLEEGNNLLRWRFFRNTSGGGGENTAWIDYITFPELVHPPRNLDAQVQDTHNVLFTWDAPLYTDNLLGYRIYNNYELFDVVDDENAVEYLCEDLPDSSYVFTFSAAYSTGEAFCTGEININIWTPNPPRNLTGSVTAPGEVTLHWLVPQSSAMYELTGYRILRDSVEVGEIDNPNTLTWMDEGVATGSHVYEAIALWGELESPPSNAVTVNVLSVAPDKVPLRTALLGCTPNPFNPDTKVRFDLAAPAKVRLEVYNILGQKVITLLDASLPAGSHSTVWRGVDTAGRPVASGLYFFRLEAGSASFVQKALLLK